MQIRWSTFRPFSIVVALIALLAACASPAGSAPPASSAPSSASTSEASGQTVHASGFAFNPATLQVKAGTQVTYVNGDPTAHTVTNGQNGKPEAQPAFDQSLAQGGSVTITFDKPGTVHVTCKIHVTMNQTVEVTP